MYVLHHKQFTAFYSKSFQISGGGFKRQFSSGLHIISQVRAKVCNVIFTRVLAPSSVRWTN